MVVPRFPSGHLAFMSRAFVNEDASSPPDPEYRLPDPASPYYLEAAAWAHMEEILGKAEAEGGDRVAQLARRYLRAARQDG
jgi:hypothetical protein